MTKYNDLKRLQNNLNLANQGKIKKMSIDDFNEKINEKRAVCINKVIASAFGFKAMEEISKFVDKHEGRIIVSIQSENSTYKERREGVVLSEELHIGYLPSKNSKRVRPIGIGKIRIFSRDFDNDSQ